MKKYLLPESPGFQDIYNRLSETHKIERGKTRHITKCILDTFDWLLYGKGWYLAREPGAYHLRAVDDDAIILSQPWKSRQHPGFWWHFPAGRLRR